MTSATRQWLEFCETEAGYARAEAQFVSEWSGLAREGQRNRTFAAEAITRAYRRMVSDNADLAHALAAARRERGVTQC